MFWEESVTEERMYCCEGHNQPASDGGNNMLVGESGRLMMGPMLKAFIKTATVVVAFT
jgi:hypothetical protein